MKLRFWFGKGDKQPKGTPANDVMERLANRFVQDSRSQGVTLDYSTESLKFIDSILENNRVGQANEDMGLVELAGAYFGEVLRRTVGGQWYEEVPPDRATGLLIDEEMDFWVWCHAVVYKQLLHGNKSLYEISEDIPARLRELKASGLPG